MWDEVEMTTQLGYDWIRPNNDLVGESEFHGQIPTYVVQTIKRWVVQRFPTFLRIAVESH